MQIRFLLAAACGALVVQPAPAEPPTEQDELTNQAELIDALRGEVDELRSTVAELKAQQDPDRPLTEARAAEIRMLVNDVLADADTRSSLLAQGMTAGWDKNFFLQSSDGNWRLRIRGQLQIRYTYNHANDQSAFNRPDDVYGFGVRRAKLKFDGNIIDPTWEYELTFGVDDDDTNDVGVLTGVGDLDLEDAYIRKDFENGFGIQVGQYKPFFLREELVSSTSQQAVDRSFVNELYNQDRTPGVAVEYAHDVFRAYAMYNDGFGEDNSAFFDSTKSNGINGRVEWLAAGDWGQFKDLQGWRGQSFGAMFGAAIQYQASKYGDINPGIGPFNTPRVKQLSWTLDASIEGNGWNVFAYVVGNHLDPQSGSTADQIGIVVQAGYMLTDKWDVFGRYEWSDLDMPGLSDVSIFTVGVNYYIDRNNLKWTTDLGVGLDSVPDNEFGIGWREDAPGEDGQVVLRSQVQLLF